MAIKFVVENCTIKSKPYETTLSGILNTLADGNTMSLKANGQWSELRSNFPEIPNESNFATINWLTYGVFISIFSFLLILKHHSLDRLLQDMLFVVLLSCQFFFTNKNLKFLFSTSHTIILSWLSFISFYIIFIPAELIYEKIGPGFGTLIIMGGGTLGLFAPSKISNKILQYRIEHLKSLIENRLNHSSHEQ
ncbi:hypothetical protein [Geothrix sp.]|uniref:hypothetical protein n=1 Tax=Geothrix sp. TaxID=1962974 RepID=UPI0025B8F0DD|nr:hypothetical protein [Geothrix sp.]